VINAFHISDGYYTAQHCSLTGVVELFLKMAGFHEVALWFTWFVKTAVSSGVILLTWLLHVERSFAHDGGTLFFNDISMFNASERIELSFRCA
jgi:hypothetical protein